MGSGSPPHYVPKPLVRRSGSLRISRDSVFTLLATAPRPRRCREGKATQGPRPIQHWTRLLTQNERDLLPKCKIVPRIWAARVCSTHFHLLKQLVGLHCRRLEQCRTSI